LQVYTLPLLTVMFLVNSS